MDRTGFETLGWAKLTFDPNLAEWAKCALPWAIKAANDPAQHVEWLRSGGTWFVGVDALGNDAKGCIAGSAPLAGPVLDAARCVMGQNDFDWGAGQVSVCYKGYPKKDDAKTDGAFNYRKTRDYAHLDGLKAVGTARRRMMEEFHGFILGIPLNETPPQAAPFIIWEGSHLIFRNMLQTAYAKAPVKDWVQIDITEIYQKTRAHIFQTCKRIELHAKPGEAYIAHRFALHGMAAWPEDANGPEDGRIIAYFRPHWQRDMQGWLAD